MTPLDSQIDNTLLFRWKNGESQVFEEFYRKYSLSLLEIAYRKTNNFESSEEIIQDVFLAFYNSKDNIEDNPAFYLKGILKHKILDYFRKSTIKILPFDEYNETHIQEEGSKMFNDILVKELDEKIRTTIDRLPLQRRTVFLMSRNESLTYSEIAERLGISVKTVEAHISKALKFLREHLDYQLFWLLVFSHWMK